jgi:uncharacterized membrane protein
MPDPQSSDLGLLHQRMDLLARINGQLIARVGELERRLAQLEGGPDPETLPAESSPALFEEFPPVDQFIPSVPTEPPAAPPFEPVPETPFPAAPPPPPSAETSFGLNWLNRIGAFTLILAAAFFFKFAVDNNWIGPTGRVLLGLAAGFALLAAAHFLNTRGHALFAQGLAGAGVSVLYLSFWASSALYHLIPSAAAFAALVAVTALAGALAYRSRALSLAALGLIGAYITPPALSTGEYHPYILFTYLLLINAAWLTFARFMDWRLLEFIALPATILVGGSVFADLRPADRGPAGSYLLFSQYAVFVFSRFTPFVHIAQVAVAIGLAIAWEKNPLGFAIASAALLSISLIAAHCLAIPALALTAAAACSAAFGLMIAFGPSSSSTLFLGAIAAFAISHTFLPFRLAKGHPPGRAELALQPLNAAAVFAAGYNYLHSDHAPWLGLFAAVLGAVYLITGLLLRRYLANLPGITNAILLSAGAALALFTAAIPLQFDSFRITVLWALEAAALSWIARRLDSRHARFSSLAVCALTAIRLLFIDSSILPDPSTYSLLFNARFTTFMLSAAGFAAAAWWLRPRSLCIPPYLAAHAALLLGLALEVTAHVRRLTPPADFFSAQMVALSILLAAYALALVSAGVATRTRGNRLLGLGLLAVVIIKLYAVDVWAMGRVYRIIAFSALGVLLLSTSFLYSRFRAKIEALLQDEDR